MDLHLEDRGENAPLTLIGAKMRLYPNRGENGPLTLSAVLREFCQPQRRLHPIVTLWSERGEAHSRNSSLV